MKNSKKDLREFLLKILNEIKDSSPAPVIEPGKKVAPSTTPTPSEPQRRRKLVPDKWPEEAPGPKPKAESEEKIGIEEIIKEMKKIEELNRMKVLISENTKIKQEMAMDIEDPYYEKPHPSVVKGIEGEKKTPFSDLNFFQGGILDYSTLEKLGSEEFNKIIRDIKTVGRTNILQNTQLLRVIMSIEQKHKPQLEKLAIRKVKEQFGIPDEVMERIKAKLDAKFMPEEEQESGNLVKDVEKDLQFTEEENQIIKQHVQKRVIQNALMMGAGYRAHTTFNSIKNDLDAIDERLYTSYMQLMPNISLIMWENPFEDMFGGKFPIMLGGVSKLEKDKNNNVHGTAKAMMFPLLLHEVSKIAIELLFANYLISLTEKYGANVAGEIIKQADVFEDEIWHKRIGPTLWKYLHDVIDYVVVHEKQGNYTLVSYLLNDISMMEPEEFIKFMNTVVYNGEKSIVIISKMIDDIERDLTSEEPMPAETDEESLQITAQEVGDELAQLAQGAQRKQKEITPENFEEMSLEQLQIELKNAIDDERYEDASKITKIIKTKT